MDEEVDYESYQESIGFKHLFRGIVMRDWKGENLQHRKYRELNKILVRKCVWFYKQCWDKRNEAYHDEEKQRNRIRHWHKKIKEYVMEHEIIEVRIFSQRTDRNSSKNDVTEMKQWIYNVKEMSKKVEKFPQDDIRRFFS